MANNQNQRRATWSNADWTSYDSRFSAMSVVLANGGTLLQFAPIIADMIGKKPKKGERVYDYDNKISVSLSNLAMPLKRAIELVMSDSFTEKSVTVGHEEGTQITIYKPNMVKLNRETFDNYVMRIYAMRDGERVRMYHILQNDSIIITAAGKKESDEDNEELVVETDLEMLLEICSYAVMNSMNIPRHAAAQVQGGSGGGKSKSSSFNNVSEDDDEDDDDEESGSRKSSSKKTLSDEFDDEDDVPSTKKAKPKQTRSLEDEFDDVPQ